MSSKSTISQVAERAETSIASVSRVINNAHNVSDELRRNVQSAIKALGYQRSSKFLITNCLGRLAVIANNDAADPNSFYNSIFEGLQYEAQRLMIEIELLLIGSLSADNEELINQLSGFDAIILVGMDHPELLSVLGEMKVPIQVINGSDPSLVYSSISPDYEQGGYLAAKYFIKNNLLRAKIVTVNLRHSIYQRQQGFSRAFTESGFDFDESTQVIDLLKISKDHYPNIYQRIIDGESGGDFGSKKMLPKLIESGAFEDCDAVFCICDMIAINLMQCFKSKRISVPQDISIIGFDDLPLSPLITPALTSVRTNYYDLARHGLAMLINKMNLGTVSSIKASVAVEIIERESVRLHE